jgi:hypothetical protein
MTQKTYIFLLLVIMMKITGCNPVEREEIDRISSPDFLVDAVLIQANAGATTSFIFEVYLVPKGNDVPPENYVLFRGDKMKGLTIRWTQAKLLEIQYEQGQIFHFSNFWISRNVQNFKYRVEILLKKL